MLSVSLEKNSGLFGTDVYDETKENKPKYEHEEGLEFGSDFDFDSEFEKYAAMGAAEKQSGAWMTNFKTQSSPWSIPVGVGPDVGYICCILWYSFWCRPVVDLGCLHWYGQVLAF